MNLSNPNFVGWTLIASGVWWILQLIFVTMLYIVGQPWGSWSDFSAALMVLLMLPLVFALYNLIRAAAPALSLIALIIGVAGIITAAVGSVLILTGRINFVQSLPPVVGGQVAIGVWFMISLWIARSSDVLPSKTAIWGIVIWFGLASLAVVLLSSMAEIAGGDWQALIPSPVVYPIILIGLIGMLGYPFWAFGVARMFIAKTIVLQ
jgi:hypothetical protein